MWEVKEKINTSASLTQPKEFIMLKQSQEDLEETFKVRITFLKEQVKLMTDIFENARKNYATKTKYRIYNYRYFCIGSLLIARNNADATAHIIDDNPYQIHYISRNMCELTVNLYYIFDDDSLREERLKRYIDFNHAVLPYKAMEIIKKYPDVFKDTKGEERFAEIERKLDEFRMKYKNFSKNYWSGMPLDKMIWKLQNKETRDDLLALYNFVVKSNNDYLHPSWHYMNKVIKDTINRTMDYETRIMLLSTIFAAGNLIIKKFLDQFPKGRPDFLKRKEELKGWFHSVKNRG